VVTTSPVSAQAQQWNTGGIQACMKTMKKAYAHDKIANPQRPSAADTSNDTYVAPMAACQNVALFAAVAKAAGRDLTTRSFTRAADHIHGLRIPGAGSVKFKSGKPYPLSTVYIGRYVPKSNAIVLAAKPAAK
jgi:hypothetical protein